MSKRSRHRDEEDEVDEDCPIHIKTYHGDEVTPELMQIIKEGTERLNNILFIQGKAGFPFSPPDDWIRSSEYLIVAYVYQGEDDEDEKDEPNTKNITGYLFASYVIDTMFLLSITAFSSGRMLMKELIKVSKQLGAKEIEVSSVSTAIGFYKKMGFIKRKKGFLRFKLSLMKKKSHKNTNKKSKQTIE